MHARPREQRRGFTLVEMLVVVVIAGIVIAMVTLSTAPAEGRRLRFEGERLAALLTAARDEAQLTGRAIVWEGNVEGYRFLQRSDSGFVAIDSDILRPRRWDSAVLAVRLEGGGPPRLVFSREPLIEPFTLAIDSGTGVVTLKGDALGRITLL